MVQRYSREEKRIWEDFRHGLFLGSQKFVDRIRSKYLSEKPDVEIPQKRAILRDTNPETLLKKAVKVLQCNTNDFLQSSRISESNKLNRDLLIYLLWSTGWYNNQEIGNLFGLGYSSISRRVTIMKSKISKDNEIHKRLEELKSLILPRSLTLTRSAICREVYHKKISFLAKNVNILTLTGLDTRIGCFGFFLV